MRSYPYKIENGSGEELVFLGVRHDQHGERLDVEVRAQPGAGPPMHLHFLQEEAMTVVAGKLGFQVEGSGRATQGQAKRRSWLRASATDGGMPAPRSCGARVGRDRRTTWN